MGHWWSPLCKKLPFLVVIVGAFPPVIPNLLLVRVSMHFAKVLKIEQLLQSKIDFRLTI